MPVTSSDGVEIYYETMGGGSPLLLINGWGGNLDSWSSEMVTLLAEKHHVILFDNRGTGRSGKPEVPYSMEMMSSDAVTVLDTLGVEKAHVMGFSMGGIIAQAIGVYYPERVLSLVLCGTQAGGLDRVNSDPHVQTELALIANPTPDMTQRDVTVKLLYLLYSKEYVEDNLEALIEDETYSDYPTPSHALMSQSAAIAGFSSYDDLPGMDMPALVMTGTDDVLVPSDNSKIIVERMPNAEHVEIPGCGHGFLKQKTDVAITSVLDFLEKIDG